MPPICQMCPMPRLRAESQALIKQHGSTGTLPMTRAFMKVISQLPMGAVIFPGIELDIEDADWRAIEQDPVHPLHQIARSMVEFELPLS